VFGSIEDAEQVGWVRMIESKKIKEILQNDEVSNNEGLIVTIAYRGMMDYIRSVADEVMVDELHAYIGFPMNMHSQLAILFSTYARDNKPEFISFGRK